MVPGQDFVGPGNDGVDDVMELGDVAGGVEVAEPVEGLKSAVVVLSKVETVELLEGVPAGFEPRVSIEELVEVRLLRGGERVASAQQHEAGSEDFWSYAGLMPSGWRRLDIAAHRGEPGVEHLMTWNRSST